ncbi:hypothetical protein ACRRTK_015125 [Alexandromys fortis]
MDTRVRESPRSATCWCSSRAQASKPLRAHLSFTSGKLWGNCSDRGEDTLQRRSAPSCREEKARPCLRYWNIFFDNQNWKIKPTGAE